MNVSVKFLAECFDERLPYVRLRRIGMRFLSLETKLEDKEEGMYNSTSYHRPECDMRRSKTVQLVTDSKLRLKRM